MTYFLNVKENYSGTRNNFLVGLGLMLVSVASLAGTVSQIPLFLAPPVKPNIMLMLDNSGSMNNIVPDSPYDPSVTVNCPTANQLAACNTFGCVQIKISGGNPSINYQGTTYTYGTGTGQKCFDSIGTYSALLIADNGSHTAPSLTTGDADYPGNYLNWYFSTSGTTGSWVDPVSLGQKVGTRSRLQIAKQSGTDLVNSLDNVRLGLSTYYNSQDGGSLLELIDDVDTNTSKKSDINAKINALKPENNTPLSETLLDIGHYFATGNTSGLTLHPGKSNQATATVAEVFTQGTKSNHQLHNDSGDTVVNPVLYSCQKNFAVLMTDGQPHLDRDINSLVRDYTGDCGTLGLCNSTPTDPNAERLPAGSLPPLTTKNYQNGTKAGRSYEWGGSDYLDDVAQALFDMDLRPDITKNKATDKSNLITYTIGFADPILANDPLLTDAATRGGGQFKTAGNSAALTAAFAGIFEDIANQVELSSASNLSANSGRLDTTTKIYQASFSSVDWSGYLKAFSLRTTSEDTNGNGILDTGEDTNGNGILDGVGSFGGKAWDMTFPAAGSRRILSYNPVTKGISFEWSTLSTSQQAALTSADVANYIRGDQTKEGAGANQFRVRNTVLGDIVNSDPLFVGKSDDYGYGLLSGSEGTDYQKFRNDSTYSNYKGSRTDVLYFGANDGMLHAMNADTGLELFAYVPNAVIPSLKKLTSQVYGCTTTGCLPHEYFVDGSPRSGDVYFDSLWHTVLLGSTGAGGSKAIFALDVTNPTSTMATSNVLWEINPSQAPFSGNLADDTVNKTPGFTNNLGYTIPQPTTARMQNGKWAAIVANGYNSVNKKAVLFILDVATGEIIRSIDTQSGSTTQPNGLSTPVPVDVDGDRIVDYIYAGDLLGNLWKFDVSSGTASNWGVAFTGGTTPAPLFTACSGASCTGSNYQPITAKPQLGRNPLGGLMIYFGTGKYFETGDHIVPSSPQAQSFYGIRDTGSVLSGRGSLQQQQILAEQAFDTDNNGTNDVVFRGTSATAVDYTGNATATPPVIAKKGWYMDLQPPTGGAKGERVVSTPIVQGKRIFFITITPSANPCKAGGVSWLMELDAVEGKRLTDASLDTDGNGSVNSSDKKRLVDTNGDNVVNASDIGISVSGARHLNSDGTDQGQSKGITVVKCESGTVCILTGDSQTNKNKDVTSIDELAGRQSWRQIR